ncbi:DegT/DnrJ/EryC1/StrS family aminotransferase [Protaetiibacter intestinalis]|uniref:DegT/DnrJ/EryC1/StrS family aminotransferase n=1 Tax=Protaetiibacter intestinalis TaxID=2419774 RepID=A0A387B7M8_9MICO|nr:DegT/DnrJ/EryC1/StrS family aminotransferase [Protaetiibacter intestinalis]AYF98357.1 DegT/DnrJ/EryC1/StrS family aminotransferase [Protaetiibacter intestinalis]
MIPISVVRFGDEEERRVLEVLRSGRIAQGPVVEEFEARFAELTGVRHAVAVNNGTTSLVAALTALDLRPGEEVVTSPFTFIATINAILEAGATVRFADISPDDFNVTAGSLAAAITDRTRVLMPVHLYGQIADMVSIARLANENGLMIVEDAAQSHGAAQGERKAGSFGIGSFSFYATKNLTTGEGGVITTDDDALAERLRIMRNQGMRARYEYVMAGHNYRMTDLQAALVVPQLDRYPAALKSRRRNAEKLCEGLAGVAGLVAPREIPGRSHVWHQYTIRVTSDASVDRDELSARLTEAGVGNGIYYPKLVVDYASYQDRDDVVIEEYPVARRIAGEVLSLPVHPELSDDDVHHIVSSVRSIMGAE